MSLPSLSQTELIERLEAFRLDKKWSYEALSQAMEQAGCHVSPSTLNGLLINPSRRAYRTTLYAISEYLRKHRAEVER